MDIQCTSPALLIGCICVHFRSGKNPTDDVYVPVLPDVPDLNSVPDANIQSGKHNTECRYQWLGVNMCHIYCYIQSDKHNAKCRSQWLGVNLYHIYCYIQSENRNTECRSQWLLYQHIYVIFTSTYSVKTATHNVGLNGFHINIYMSYLLLHTEWQPQHRM